MKNINKIETALKKNKIKDDSSDFDQCLIQKQTKKIHVNPNHHLYLVGTKQL